jgi:hypothetical protein
MTRIDDQKERSRRRRATRAAMRAKNRRAIAKLLRENPGMTTDQAIAALIAKLAQ